MNRRRLLVLAGMLTVAALAAGAPRVARADGGGKDGGPKEGEPKKEKDPKDTPAGRACAAVGADFQSKKSQELVDRVRAKGKLHLALGGAGDSYAADQAKAVLDQWFREKKELKAELTSVTGLTGKFKLTWRDGGTDKLVEKTLCVTVEKREKGEGFHLAKIEIL